MNENYEIKGSVRKLVQRKPCVAAIAHLRSLDNFDVEFSPSGRVLQITNYTGALAIIGSERFSYDETGKMIRAVQFDNTGAATGKNHIEYEKGGTEIVGISRNPLGDVTGRTVETHEGGRQISFAAYDASAQLKREKTFQYSGNVLLRSDSKYYGADGGVNEQWISTYDSNGRIAETFGLKADGTPLGDGKYKYEYDAEGRKRRVSTFTEFGDDEAASGLKIYEYACDEFGNWIERREFHKFRGDLSWSKTVTIRNLTYYQS